MNRRQILIGMFAAAMARVDLIENIDGIDFDPDPSGNYLACGLEEEGKIYLAQLIDNRPKWRQSFDIDDINGMIDFIEDAFSNTICFIDWYAAEADSGEIPTYDLNSMEEDDLEAAIKRKLKSLTPRSFSA